MITREEIAILTADAPKDPLKNADYRKQVIEICAQHPEVRYDVWCRCAREAVWFTDVFGWTYSPKDYPNAPHRAFILWPFQERAIATLDRGIQRGHDVLIEKSRDMGASWICLLVILRRFLFSHSQSFLVGSRKEEYVDKKGDPKTLFYKLDYMLSQLPGWLRSPVKRTDMHLFNLETQSTIDGESTNKDFATGDRRTAILLDEFAKVEKGESIAAATRDVTHCRIFNSTPEGASGAYYEQRSKMLVESPNNVVRLHWSEHPEKSRGLYSSRMENGRLVVKKLDPTYQYPPDYRFGHHPNYPIRSPWADEQWRRSLSDQEIATNLEIDYSGSGHPYMAADRLEDCLKRCRPPVKIGELLFDARGENPRFVESPTGRLRLWFEPDGKGRTPPGEFGVGSDVSFGAGGRYSSNSASSCMNRTTGGKLAELVANDIDPRDFADYSVALCKWFNMATLIWDNTGPAGGGFSKRVVELKYRLIYDPGNDPSTLSARTSGPGGFKFDGTNVFPTIDAYAKSLLVGECDNPSREAVEEIGQFVHLPNGKIAHSQAKNDDPTQSGLAHGDRVTADALAWQLCRKKIGDKPESELALEAPVNSFAWRQRQHRAMMSRGKGYFSRR